MANTILKLAIPKGRLQQGVTGYLSRIGINFSFKSDRDYKPAASEAGIEAKILKPRAVPQLVALGNYDIGFCGLDILANADYEQAVPILNLGLNPVTLVVAVPNEKQDILSNAPKRPLLIATEYEQIADRWAMKKGLAHITIQTYGSTEGYAPDDADIVFDCMETGRTLEANGLVVIEKLMDSATYMIANKAALEDENKKQKIIELKKRLEKALEDIK